MWHINCMLVSKLSVSVNETILIFRVLLSVKIYLNISIQFYIAWHLRESYFTVLQLRIARIIANACSATATCKIEMRKHRWWRIPWVFLANVIYFSSWMWGSDDVHRLHSDVGFIVLVLWVIMLVFSSRFMMSLLHCSTLSYYRTVAFWSTYHHAAAAALNFVSTKLMRHLQMGHEGCNINPTLWESLETQNHR